MACRILFFVQHEQGKNQNASHGGDVEQAGFVNAEKKEFQQQQPGTQSLVKESWADSADVENPHAQAACRHQRNNPNLPPHRDGNQV